MDVRTEAEFLEGNVNGSINIPLNEVVDRIMELKAMQPLVLCCLSGGRSGQATDFLQAQGCNDVHNGGGWEMVSFPEKIKMKVEQIYTICLAQGAYYIESNGQAAVIDPLREVEAYIEMAAERGAKIKYVFETHFHADFVSGHLSLAKQTGAQIVFGPTAKTNFEAVIAEDNQVFEIGNISIKVLHTPGHTMESSCYLLSR